MPQTPLAQPTTVGSVQPAYAPGGAWRLAHGDPAAISQAQQVYLASQALQSSAVFLGLVSQGNEVARSHGRMVELLFQAAGGQVRGPPEPMLPGPQFTQVAYQLDPRVVPGPGPEAAPCPAPPLPLAQVHPAPPGLWHSRARPRAHGPHHQSGRSQGGDVGVDSVPQPRPLPPQGTGSQHCAGSDGGALDDLPAGPQGRALPAHEGGRPDPSQPQELGLYCKAQAMGKAVPAVGNRLPATHKHSLETAAAAKRMWYQDTSGDWWPNPWENPDGEVPKSGPCAQPTPPGQAHVDHEDPLYSSEGDPWGRQPTPGRQEESKPSGSGSRGLQRTLPAWVKPGTVALTAAQALPGADAAAHGPVHLAQAVAGMNRDCALPLALALLVALGLWYHARRDLPLVHSCPRRAAHGRLLIGKAVSSTSRPTTPTMRGLRSGALLLTLALIVASFGARPVDVAFDAGHPLTGLGADLPILNRLWTHRDTTQRDRWEAKEPWLSPDSTFLFPAPDLCSWPGTALSFCDEDAALDVPWAADCSVGDANATALPRRAGVGGELGRSGRSSPCLAPALVEPGQCSPAPGSRTGPRPSPLPSPLSWWGAVVLSARWAGTSLERRGQVTGAPPCDHGGLTLAAHVSWSSSLSLWLFPLFV